MDASFKLGGRRVKYKLTFLGVNSFFSNGIDQFHSNLLLENEEGKALLIDCGTDLKMFLAKANKKVENIDAVYVSHCHGDHASLEYLGFYTHFITKKKPTLYSHYTHFYDQPYNLWEVLRPSMEALDEGNVYLSEYFRCPKIDRSFEWSGIKFELLPFFHIENKDQIIFSYGLMFEINKKIIFFSSDTKENTLPFAETMMADIIFHDCETYGLVMPPGSKVHAHYEDLEKADPKIKAKTWLYHYQDLGKNMPNAKADGFARFVQTGQVFEF